LRPLDSDKSTSGLQVFNKAAVDVARCVMLRIWKTRMPAHAISIAIEKWGLEIPRTIPFHAADAL
jgi:hypothetical protein